MHRELTYREYYNMAGDQFEPGDVIQANLVMVIGQTGRDYAVYVGDGDWPPEMVARHGDKLMRQEEVAEALFPTAAHGRYARR